ncbi:MAG: enoyl-CoA hydratase [Rhodobacteraceae bacterium]|nr:enoyl-CoA hydratase [Paracoccaceae bacterium]
MDVLEREDHGAIARLTLNRPGALNALSDDLLGALGEEFDRLADDGSINAVVISGAGKAFCAGHDLKEIQAGRQAADRGETYFDDLFARCSVVMQKIGKLPQPVIAQVHGIATAAGCQLVATCDLAVAAQSARFGVNGVNIGLFCLTPMVALTRNVTPKKSFELLTTGRFATADEAEALGLVNRVAPDDLLAEATMELAGEVASKLRSAMALGKQTFYAQRGLDTAAAYDLARQAMVRNILNKDTDEGIQGFIEKRAPNWKK